MGGLYVNYNLDRQSDIAEANNRLEEGIILYNQKKFEQSLEMLEKITISEGLDWRLPYYKASALVKLEDYSPAAKYLEEALILNSNDTRILFALGVVYYKLGNLNLAEGYFASTLEIDPGHEHAKGLMDIMSRLQRNQQPVINEEDEPDRKNKSG
jgi:tetratricopeptide (TPR) repeat protein